MEAVEASVSGTVRLILVLLIIWWALRLVQRRWGRPVGTSGTEALRRKGEVRIENATPSDRQGAPGRAGGPSIADAEYEEIEKP